MKYLLGWLEGGGERRVLGLRQLTDWDEGLQFSNHLGIDLCPGISR